MLLVLLLLLVLTILTFKVMTPPSVDTSLSVVVATVHNRPAERWVTDSYCELSKSSTGDMLDVVFVYVRRMVLPITQLSDGKTGDTTPA